MKSHELLRRLLQDRNAKELAEEMGLSTSTIYKWTEPAVNGGSGTQNPLDRVEQLIALTNGGAVAHWVCERAGGFYVKNPHLGDGSEHQPVVVATNRIVQEFAEMLSLVTMAAIDNTITEEEARDIRDRWESVKSATEEYVNCCELGHFREMKERLAKSQKPSPVSLQK